MSICWFGVEKGIPFVAGLSKYLVLYMQRCMICIITCMWINFITNPLLSIPFPIQHIQGYDSDGNSMLEGMKKTEIELRKMGRLWSKVKTCTRTSKGLYMVLHIHICYSHHGLANCKGDLESVW